MSRIESPGWMARRSSKIGSSGRSGRMAAWMMGACVLVAEAEGTDLGADDGPTYLSGRNSVKVLPTPGELRKWISPPSRFDNSRLIARPNPVPPYLRLVLASACWNASKMIFCFSGGMPIPVSETSSEITLEAVDSDELSG